MSFPPKKLNNTDPGTATAAGGDDWDKISDYFNDVNAGGTAVIDTDTEFRSSRLKVSNPAETFKYTVVGSAIAANRNVTEPLLTGDDTRVYVAHPATLTNKSISGSTNTITNVPDAALTSNIPKKNTANSFTGIQTITDTTQVPLVLYRTANAVATTVGIAFDMNDSANGEATYAFFLPEIVTNTAGAHSGAVNLYVVQAGVSRRVLRIDEAGIIALGGINRRLKLDETGLTSAHTMTFPDQDTLVAGQNFINFFSVAQFLANNIPLRTKDAAAVNRNMLIWDSTDHLILGTSAAIAATYIYAGAASAALNISNTNHLTFTKMAETTTAEELISTTVSDDVNASFTLGNAFNTASLFVPILTSTLSSNSTASHGSQYNYHAIVAANDTGSVPCVINNVYRDTPAAITTRPLEAFRNNGSNVFLINPGGIELADTKDIVINSTTGSKIGQSNSKIGFYGVTPVVKPAANADTSGATLPQLETEVNELKALLRSVGLLS